MLYNVFNICLSAAHHRPIGHRMIPTTAMVAMGTIGFGITITRFKLPVGIWNCFLLKIVLKRPTRPIGVVHFECLTEPNAFEISFSWCHHHLCQFQNLVHRLYYSRRLAHVSANSYIGYMTSPFPAQIPLSIRAQLVQQEESANVDDSTSATSPTITKNACPFCDRDDFESSMNKHVHMVHMESIKVGGNSFMSNL